MTTVDSGDSAQSRDVPDIATADRRNNATRQENAYTVVTAVDLTQSVTLDRLTVTGGNANVLNVSVDYPSRSGGGIYDRSGLLTITNSTISLGGKGGKAPGAGGGGGGSIGSGATGGDGGPGGKIWDLSTLNIAELYESWQKSIKNSTAGAGGGGFLLLVVPREKQNRLFETMVGYRELPFMIEESGSKVIFDDRTYSSK